MQKAASDHLLLMAPQMAFMVLIYAAQIVAELGVNHSDIKMYALWARDSFP